MSRTIELPMKTTTLVPVAAITLLAFILVWVRGDAFPPPTVDAGR